MADDIIQFQAGREAAMRGDKRDGRKHRDWLQGFDQVKAMERLIADSADLYDKGN